PRRSLNQPAGPQFVIATDMILPPGVTRCRKGDVAEMHAISRSNVSARSSAKPCNTHAPDASFSHVPISDGISNKGREAGISGQSCRGLDYRRFDLHRANTT